MARNSFLILLLAVCALLALSWPGEGIAQGAGGKGEITQGTGKAPPTPPVAQNPLPPAQGSHPERICPNYPGLSGKLVHCVRDGVVKASTAFLDGVYGFFKPAITLAVILAITVYGLMILTGQLRSPLGDTFKLLFKIIAVLLVTQHFTDIYTAAIAFSEGMLTLVTDATSDSVTMSCGGDASDVWKRVDCALEKIIGISDDMALISGMTGLVTALFLTAAWGVFLALLALSIIFLLVLAIAEAMYIYLNAFIALACMAMLAPLFIPMSLFKYTQVMFDKWLKMSISFTLQPMFLFAYLTLMLSAFDTVVIEGSHSLYRTMTGKSAEEVRDRNFSIGKYFIDNDLYLDEVFAPLCIGTDPSKLSLPKEGQKLKPNEVLTTATKALGPVKSYLTNTTLQGICDFSSSVGIEFEYTSIDMKEWAEEKRHMSVEALRKQLFISFIMAALIAYIMHATMSYIPLMGTEIAGGLLDGVNMARIGKIPGAGLAKGLVP